MIHRTRWRFHCRTRVGSKGISVNSDDSTSKSGTGHVAVRAMVKLWPPPGGCGKHMYATKVSLSPRHVGSVQLI